MKGMIWSTQNLMNLQCRSWPQSEITNWLIARCSTVCWGMHQTLVRQLQRFCGERPHYKAIPSLHTEGLRSLQIDHWLTIWGENRLVPCWLNVTHTGIKQWYWYCGYNEWWEWNSLNCVLQMLWIKFGGETLFLNIWNIVKCHQSQEDKATIYEQNLRPIYCEVASDRTEMSKR